MTSNLPADPQAVILKLAARIAELQVAVAFLETALEAAVKQPDDPDSDK